MKYSFLLLLCFSCCMLLGQTGSVGINDNSSTPHPSAMLDVNSSTKGFLAPRMTTTERMAISDPATGLMVYDTDKNTFWCYAGSGPGWVEIRAGYVALLADADGDTRIQVEESTDDDVIRFDQEGVEYFTMHEGRIEVLNTGESIFIGEGAGQNDDLTDNRNVFVGHQSGINSNTGYSNTTIGFRTLYNNTFQSNQVAVGDSALSSNGLGIENTNEGQANTAVGSKSLGLNTRGYSNTATGFKALYNNTTGYQNTATGNLALAGNLGGYGNTTAGWRLW